MTQEQKQQIQDMRRKGLGYKKIANWLGISENTVKSYCKRNNFNADNNSKNNELSANATTSQTIDEALCTCKQCGKAFLQKPKTRPKTFCCDKCRFAWWNDYRCKLKRRARREQRAV